MLDISVWDINGKKKSRFGPVSDLSYAIIVILSIETAGIVILRCVTIGTVAAPVCQVMSEAVLVSCFHVHVMLGPCSAK